jgi:hypothetical protein
MTELAMARSLSSSMPELGQHYGHRPGNEIRISDSI